MPNINVGGDMPGLIRYLRGPGRSEEHEAPHVVAGSDFLVGWHGDEVLDEAAGRHISSYLEQPREFFGVEVTEVVKSADPETGEAHTSGYRDAHVWHCSLSVRAEEGPLGDEKWQAIASDFMDEMGFTDRGAGEGKAPCRWVAIHHGKSTGGNDHIHIAASRVREDGTKWEGRGRDEGRSQLVSHELEIKHGLQVVREGYAHRGEQYAETAQADRLGREQTVPAELGERIRSAGVASESEAEWVRRLRTDGVVVKPRYAKGSTTEVVGFRAAVKPESYNDKLVFYGGRTLGKDLSLPRLREQWGPPSAAESEAASAEWGAAFRGEAPVNQGREAVAFDRFAPDMPDKALARFAQFNDRLAQVPYGDRAAWGDAARDVSAGLSAWARFDKENATELRAAARSVSVSAQVKRSPGAPQKRDSGSLMGVALVLAAASDPSKKKQINGLLLMRQMLKTLELVRDCHQATGQLRHAQQLQVQAIDRLRRVPLAGYASAPTGPAAQAAVTQAAQPPALREPSQEGWTDEAKEAYKVGRLERSSRPFPAPGGSTPTAPATPGNEPDRNDRGRRGPRI